MEYKEAYEILLEVWQGDKTEEEGFPDYDDINEALDKIKELVDKTTPKKVIKNTKKDYWGSREYNRIVSVRCPSCKARLRHFQQESTNYCRECGQRLDWGNGNGN